MSLCGVQGLHRLYAGAFQDPPPLPTWPKEQTQLSAKVSIPLKHTFFIYHNFNNNNFINICVNLAKFEFVNIYIKLIIKAKYF